MPRFQHFGGAGWQRAPIQAAPFRLTSGLATVPPDAEPRPEEKTRSDGDVPAEQFRLPDNRRQRAESISPDEPILRNDTAPDEATARHRLLPVSCPGCGALSQVFAPDEAGFYKLTRKGVQAYLAARAAIEAGSGGGPASGEAEGAESPADDQMDGQSGGELGGQPGGRPGEQPEGQVATSPAEDGDVAGSRPEEAAVDGSRPGEDTLAESQPEGATLDGLRAEEDTLLGSQLEEATVADPSPENLPSESGTDAAPETETAAPTRSLPRAQRRVLLDGEYFLATNYPS